MTGLGSKTEHALLSQQGARHTEEWLELAKLERIKSVIATNVAAAGEAGASRTDVADAIHATLVRRADAPMAAPRAQRRIQRRTRDPPVPETGRNISKCISTLGQIGPPQPTYMVSSPETWATERT